MRIIGTRLCVFLCFAFSYFAAAQAVESTNDDVTRTPYSLLFVYLGDRVPEYSISSISQARMFNKECNIYFLLSKAAYSSQNSLVERLLKENVSFVFYEDFVKTQEHTRFEKICSDHGKNGYWRYTTERFFYIDEFMTAYNLTDVFQIECDVMLYVNLNDYMHIFHKYHPSIASPFECDEVASVSFVYFSNPTAIRNFATFISQTVPSEFVDMKLLAMYKKSTLGEAVDHLPTNIAEYIDYAPFVTGIGQIASQPYKYWNHFDEWNSFFDPDWLGTYLVKGSLERWMGNQCFIDTKYFCFKWEKDSEGRSIPYAYFFANKKKYRLNTLHIFPKNCDSCLSIGGYPFPPRVGSQWKD